MRPVGCVQLLIIFLCVPCRTTMVYARKRRAPSRYRKVSKRRRFNIPKRRVKYGRIGYFKVMRWSSKDSTNNCHLLLQGNDTLPDVTGATTFALSDVNGYTEIQGIADNYSVDKILYRFVCTRNPDWASTTANRGWSTRICWSHDFNDSAPISQALLFQRANLREAYLNSDRLQTKWYSLKPALLAQMYEGATATAYSPKWRQMIDTSDLSPYYGIKYAVQNLYGGINLRMEAKLYIRAKGTS